MSNKNFSDDFLIFALMLFSDSFHCDPESASTNMHLELIELQESYGFKSSFRAYRLTSIIPQLQPQFIKLCASMPPKMASLFGITYICEKTFSVMNFNKSKWRTALTNQHFQSILEIFTTQYTQRYETLIGEKSQLHTLH